MAAEVTHPLGPDAARRDAARRFGEELRTAMRKRGVGQPRLAKASKVGRSSIANYCEGQNLPTIATAIRLADALGAPRLVEIARAGRSRACGSCGKPILVEGYGPRRYCDELCRRTAELARRDRRPLEPASRGVQLLQTELLRIGAPRKQVIGRAITILLDERGLELERLGEERLAVYAGTVEAMCRGCEPDGVCKLADCALRPVSPLPIVEMEHEADVAQLARRWADHPERRAQLSDRMREFWREPGRAERQGRLLRDAWARLTPEQRERRIAASVAGRKDARA